MDSNYMSGRHATVADVINVLNTFPLNKQIVFQGGLLIEMAQDEEQIVIQPFGTCLLEHSIQEDEIQEASENGEPPEGY